jgi:hypothetical protein
MSSEDVNLVVQRVPKNGKLWLPFGKVLPPNVQPIDVNVNSSRRLAYL